MRRLTKDEFKIRAKIVHGDKYDYSNVVYKNSQIKVCIICPKHGAFYQTPNGHLTGKGCPKCRDEYTSLRCTLSTDEFIAKAMNAHGDKYDYSQVRYVNTKTPVEIICPKHGLFLQVPNYHLSGCGCPLCGKESLKTHSMSNTKIYNVHAGMVDRCRNKNHSKYKNYGGRGISVCDEWLSFDNFYKWAADSGYKEGLTIERIDVNGNYEPNNCKWIPQREQYYNMTNTLFIDFGLFKKSISELSRIFNINSNKLRYHFHRYGSEGAIKYIKKMTNIDINKIKKLPYHKEFITGEY